MCNPCWTTWFEIGDNLVTSSPHQVMTMQSFSQYRPSMLCLATFMFTQPKKGDKVGVWFHGIIHPSILRSNIGNKYLMAKSLTATP